MEDEEEEVEASVRSSHADDFSDKEEEEEKAHRDQASAYLVHLNWPQAQDMSPYLCLPHCAQASGLDETFVVLWHEGDKDVKAMEFDNLDDANDRFDELDGGPYATILVRSRFDELRYYGTRGRHYILLHI